MSKKQPPQNPASWQQFGEFLFKYREADPGYYVVRGLIDAGYSPQKIRRFVAGWVTFYNLGLAARASEITDPAKWFEFMRGVYPTATRASERRHFRGAAGLNAIGQWQNRYGKPEAMVEHMLQPGGDLEAVRVAAKEVAQMGPYFVWKFGDLTEVITGEALDFKPWVHYSPKVPTQGAQLIWEENPVNVGLGDGFGFTVKEDLRPVYNEIAAHLNKRKVRSFATPWRRLDVQDAETVCCVYKQYRSGSYWPGLRTAKAIARLRADGGSTKTAKLAIQILQEEAEQTGLLPFTTAAMLTGDERPDIRRFIK